QGLLCLFDAVGPCANAVKDSQRTKTTAQTTRVLVCVWGARGLPGRALEAARWYAQLVNEAGGLSPIDQVLQGTVGQGRPVEPSGAMRAARMGPLRMTTEQDLRRRIAELEDENQRLRRNEGECPFRRLAECLATGAVYIRNGSLWFNSEASRIVGYTPEELTTSEAGFNALY